MEQLRITLAEFLKTIVQYLDADKKTKIKRDKQSFNADQNSSTHIKTATSDRLSQKDASLPHYVSSPSKYGTFSEQG